MKKMIAITLLIACGIAVLSGCGSPASMQTNHNEFSTDTANSDVQTYNPNDYDDGNFGDNDF